MLWRVAPAIGSVTVLMTMMKLLHICPNFHASLHHVKIITPHIPVHLQMALDMRYGESSHSHQLQNSLRCSSVLASQIAYGMDEAAVEIRRPSQARNL